MGPHFSVAPPYRASGTGDAKGRGAKGRVAKGIIIQAALKSREKFSFWWFWIKIQNKNFTEIQY